MLKLVFEWCRIHIKTVLAQYYSLVVFYPILRWFTYAWFIQANPSRSAQVRLSLPRSIPTPRFSQVLPSSPRFSQEISDFLRFCGVSGISDFVRFLGFPGRTWVLFSAILLGFRDFLGEPGCYFLRFCKVSGISWENLGGNSWGWAWESCELVRGKVAGGWPAILTHDFLISAAGVAAPFGLQVCHALKFSYKHYRGIASK